LLYFLLRLAMRVVHDTIGIPITGVCNLLNLSRNEIRTQQKPHHLSENCAVASRSRQTSLAPAVFARRDHRAERHPETLLLNILPLNYMIPTGRTNKKHRGHIAKALMLSRDTRLRTDVCPSVVSWCPSAVKACLA